MEESNTGKNLVLRYPRIYVVKPNIKITIFFKHNKSANLLASLVGKDRTIPIRNKYDEKLQGYWLSIDSTVKGQFELKVQNENGDVQIFDGRRIIVIVK